MPIAAQGSTVSSGSSLSVSSGQTSNGLQVQGLLTVESGGVVSATSVTDGGQVDLFGSAYATQLTPSVSGYAQMTVESGAYVSGTVAIGASEVDVFGSADAQVISAGADAYLYSGALVSGDVLVGGYENVSYGASDLGLTIGALGQVSNEGVVQAVIGQGGDEVVYDGGVDSGTEVQFGGQLQIQGGGLTSNTVVDSGGQLLLSSGASASGVVVSSGGVLEAPVAVSGALTAGMNPVTAVASVTVVDGVTLEPGAVLSATEYDVTSTVALPAGAFITADVVVQSGGLLSGPGVIAEPGQLTIAYGGEVSGATLLNDYDAAVVGSATGVTVDGGTLEVSGGQVSNVRLTRGAQIYFDLDQYGVGSGVVLDDAQAFVYSGNSVYGTVISSGVEDLAGAKSYGATVLAGGVQIVAPGALDSGTVVSSGGVEVLQPSARTSGVTVQSGGIVGVQTTIGSGVTSVASGLVTTSAFASGGVTFQSGSIQQIEAAEIRSGGVLILPQGSVLAGFAVVDQGGTLSGPGLVTHDVDDEGLVSGVAFDNASLVIYGSAADITATKTGATDGNVQLETGATLSDATIGSGVQLMLYSGAVADAITFLPGAQLVLENLPADNFAISGSTLDLTSGGQVVAEIGLTPQDRNISATVGYDLYGDVIITATSATPVPDNFQGTGRSEVLIENGAGAVVLGQVSGGSLNWSQVGALGPEWSFQTVGDFYGGGADQALLENSAGAVVLADLTSGQATYAQIGALGPEWAFEGAGALTGGPADQFLIENGNGVVDMGSVNTSGAVSYTEVSVLGSEWSFHGVGNFAGQSQAQVLLENTNGAVVLGQLVSGTLQYQQVGALGPEWSFEGVGDFLGDGRSDVLIENTAGAVVVGEISSSGLLQYLQVGALGSEWKFVGVSDASGAGVDSFLIENSVGAIVAGTVVSGQAQYAQVGALGPEWKFHG